MNWSRSRSPLFILALSFLALFSQCGEPVKISSTGKAGELIVVCSPALWNSTAGDTLRYYLASELDGLPQQEELFKLVHLKPDDLSGILQQHRNILFLDIKPDAQVPMSYQENKWSAPQLIVNLSAKDTSALIEAIAGNGSFIADYFNAEERKRLIAAYSRIADKTMQTAVKKRFDFDMTVPEGFFLAYDRDGFMWIRRESPDMTQGIFIYTTAYKDSNTFDGINIITQRDSLTKKYIPGPNEGSYMATEMAFPGAFKSTTLAGNYAREIRGLWKIEGDFMGGPIITYAVYDEANNRIIYLNGFVYAPRFDKREYLRQLDAIMHSLKLEGKKV